MSNTITDLNEHLFNQLKRLSDTNLKGEELKAEISRSKAIKDISQEFIAAGRLALDAQKELGHSIREGDLPPFLEVKREGN